MANIIAVKVDAANAASAARIANAYAKVYVDREFQSKNATMTSVEDALQRRIDTLSVALQKPDAQSFLREEYLDDLAELRALAKRRSMIVSEADVVSKAYPPANPSFPPRLMFLMAGWIVSLGLGAGAGWFLDKGRRGVRSARDLEHFVGVPNVLEVPFAAESPRHRIGLAHRKRRRDWGCGLAALGRGDLVLEMLQVSAQRMKSVLVTSVHSGEGKSTVALALGRAAAGEGAKVVILDCDVHTPGLRRDFNLHDPNLEEALTGIDKDSDKLQLHSDPLSNCLICTCGQLAPGAASRVFRSPEFRTLIRGLSARFDLVLIDGPSSGTNFSEVVPLSWVADLTLLLARFEMTPLSDVQAAVRNLARVSGSKFATGLNAVRGTGHGQI
jgi:Mrp family chromosome partitioning ATPase